MQRAAERRLEPDAELPHPLRAPRRSGDEQARQLGVALVLGYPVEICEKLVLRVGLGQQIGWRRVRTSEVASVTAVAAAKVAGRPFEHEHARAGLARR